MQNPEAESKELGTRMATLIFFLFPEAEDQERIMAQIENLPVEQLPLLLAWLEAKYEALAQGLDTVIDAQFAEEVATLKKDYEVRQEAIASEALAELSALEKELED